MAQAHIARLERSDQSETDQYTSINKWKVNLNLDGNHHISIFRNEEGQTVVNIRKGTRSVSISKDVLAQICDLKETI